MNASNSGRMRRPPKYPKKYCRKNNFVNIILPLKSLLKCTKEGCHQVISVSTLSYKKKYIHTTSRNRTTFMESAVCICVPPVAKKLLITLKTTNALTKTITTSKLTSAKSISLSHVNVPTVVYVPTRIKSY